MPKRGETARALAQCFGSAVFTVSEAGSAGLTPRRLRLAAAAGAVVSLGGGKYYVPEPGMDSREQYLRRVRAAQLSREGSVAAGVSGAALWGLRCPDPCRRLVRSAGLPRF